MAKRVEPGDQTMELSTSQLVPDAPPRPRMPPPQIAPHDASVWKQVVVGSADFAPPPKARPGRARTWAIVGAASIAVGVGGAFAWQRMESDGAPAASSSAEPPLAIAKSSDPKPAETSPAAPKPPSSPPAPAIATEAPAAGSAGSTGPAGSAGPPESPESPALVADEPPPTWLTDFAAWLSPPDAVASLFGGLAPWTPTATAAPPAPAAKKPLALKKTPIAPKKPAPAPKKPVPPAKSGRR